MGSWGEKKGLVRLSVFLNRETADALKAQAARAGSLSEAIRRAISIVKHLDDHRRVGYRIVIEDKHSGWRREVSWDD